MPRLITTFRYVWSSPNTLLGLLFLPLAKVTGGGARLHTGVLEIHGGIVAKLLEHAPCVGPGGATALTLGHAVLARSTSAHDLSRDHERVHVRQYERWGPLFLPAYGIASLLAWMKGKDPYRGNRFEVEAYDSAHNS